MVQNLNGTPTGSFVDGANLRMNCDEIRDYRSEEWVRVDPRLIVKTVFVFLFSDLSAATANRLAGEVKTLEADGSFRAAGRGGTWSQLPALILCLDKRLLASSSSAVETL